MTAPDLMVWFCRTTGEQAPSRTWVPWARLTGQQLTLRLHTGAVITGFLAGLYWDDGAVYLGLEDHGEFGWQPAVTEVFEVEEVTPPVRLSNVLEALLLALKDSDLTTNRPYPEFLLETSDAIYTVTVERNGYWPWADRTNPSTGVTPGGAGDWLSVQIY